MSLGDVAVALRQHLNPPTYRSTRGQFFFFCCCVPTNPRTAAEQLSGQAPDAFSYLVLSNEITHHLSRDDYTQSRVATGEQQAPWDRGRGSDGGGD